MSRCSLLSSSSLGVRVRLLRVVATGSLSLAEIGLNWLREAFTPFGRLQIVPVEAGTSAVPSTTYARCDERSFGPWSVVASITSPFSERVLQQREHVA